MPPRIPLSKALTVYAGELSDYQGKISPVHSEARKTRNQPSRHSTSDGVTCVDDYCSSVTHCTFR